MELRHVNNEFMENLNNGNISLKDSEPLHKHYATILVQLKEAGEKAFGFQELIFSFSSLLSSSCYYSFFISTL